MMDYTLFGFAVHQYIFVLLIIAGLFILKRVLLFLLTVYFKKFAEKTETDIDDMILEKCTKPIIYFLYVVAFYLLINYFNVSPNWKRFLYKVIKSLFALNLSYLFFGIVDVIEYKFKCLAETTETKIDDQLVPILRKILKAFILIIIVIWIIDIWGYNPLSIIASLGIGGLAIALAAKDTIANIFGSITIFIDKPYQVGDRVKSDDFNGTIEEIGLRCTKIRNLDGSQVTMANNILVNKAVENIGRRPSIKQMFTIGVTYDTSRDKLLKAVDIIKNILSDTEGVIKDDFHVHFNEYGAFSLNILVLYFYEPPDWWEFNTINEKINFQIMEAFEKAGIEFAFPTQTVYMKKDD